MLQTINGIPAPDIFALHKIYGKDNAAFIAEQIECLPRAKAKLPKWASLGCLFTRQSLEQAGSESVSNFKASLFCGKELLSLTGGLGVDECALSGRFDRVTSLDPDAALNRIARYNFGRLGITNIERLDQSAEDFLKMNKLSFDMLYADPDRRAGKQRETINVAAYAPDIFTLHRQYRDIAGTWLIKLSPMVDLAWIRKALGEPCRIYVVANKREIKELLVQTGLGVSDENIVVETEPGHLLQWQGEPLMPEPLETESVFIPSSALVKAGFCNSLHSITGLQTLNRENSLFSSLLLMPYGLGRTYQIVDTFRGSIHAMGRYLKEKRITKANIICRNFTMKAPDLIRKLKIEEGGGIFLVFTKDLKGEGLMLICKFQVPENMESA